MIMVKNSPDVVSELFFLYGNYWEVILKNTIKTLHKGGFFMVHQS